MWRSTTWSPLSLFLHCFVFCLSIYILHQSSRASQRLGPLFQTIRWNFPPEGFVSPVSVRCCWGQYGTTGYAWQVVDLHTEALPFDSTLPRAQTWTADGAILIASWRRFFAKQKESNVMWKRKWCREFWISKQLGSTICVQLVFGSDSYRLYLDLY